MKGFAVGVVVAIAVFLWWTGSLPASPNQPPVTVTQDVSQVVLTAVRQVNRHEFGEQQVQTVHLITARPDGLPGQLGMKKQYTAIIVGKVTAIIDMSQLADSSIAQLPDGSVTLILPEVRLVAATDLQASQIYHESGFCPEAICTGYDRLTALKGLEPQAKEAMIEQAEAGDLRELARTAAIDFYRQLLSNAGVTVRVQ